MTRAEFERKDQLAKLKLEQFEQRRMQEAAEMKRQAELKAQKMVEVAQQNENLEN